MSTPFTQENVHMHEDGRWYHDGRDVTDLPIDWKCPSGHVWKAVLAANGSPDDPGCPACG